MLVKFSKDGKEWRGLHLFQPLEVDCFIMIDGKKQLIESIESDANDCAKITCVHKKPLVKDKKVIGSSTIRLYYHIWKLSGCYAMPGSKWDRCNRQESLVLTDAEKEERKEYIKSDTRERIWRRKVKK